MISSIFGKTKPINFILVGVFLAVFFIGGFLFEDDSLVFSKLWGPGIFTFLILIFSLLVVDFVAKRNNLTKQNNYVILVFGLCIALFSQVFSDFKIVVANFFILLAFRRLLSLKSLKQVKLKILDAALWISVAVICYEWTVLYFVFLYLVIAKFVAKDFKNWIIPFVGIFITGILFLCFAFAFRNEEWLIHYFNFEITLGREKFLEPSFLLPFGVVILISLVSIVFYWLKGKSKSVTKQASMIMVLQALLISIIIAIISESNNGSEFLFSFFPMAVFISNYLQEIRKKWLKEAILWSLVALSFAVVWVLAQ